MTMRHRRPGRRPCLGAVLALVAVMALFALVPPSALADMVVVRSNGDPLKPGQTIAAGTTVTLPAGASATLLDQDGKTVTLTGPFSGLAEAAAAAHGDPKVVTALSRLLVTAAADTSSLGMMRGAAIRDPYTIALTGGTHCQVADRRPFFSRSSALAADARLTITAATGSEAVLTWRAGRHETAWPTDELPALDGVYLLRLTDQPTPVRLIFRRVPADLQGVAAVAAWMAGHDCANQALALLNALP